MVSKKQSSAKPTARPWSERPVELDSTELLSSPPSKPPEGADFSIDFDPAPSDWTSMFGPSSNVLAPPVLPGITVDIERTPSMRWREVWGSVGTAVRAHRTWIAAVGIMFLGAAASWTLVPLARGRAQQDPAVTRMAVEPVATREPVQAAPRAPENVRIPAPAPTETAPPTPVRASIAGAPSRTKPARVEPARTEPKAPAPPAVAAPPPSPPPPAAIPERAPPPAAPSFGDVEVAGEFDRNAAMQALRQAGDAARPCLTGAAAADGARVAVTFARSGRVSDVSVEGALNGTPIGSCVAGKFRGLSVPPFRGSSMTVRKTITL
jgi:hypothetical protein